MPTIEAARSMTDNPDIIVRRYAMMTTGVTVYEAFEPADGHTSLLSRPGLKGYYGTVTSRPLPAHLNSLPGLSAERYNAVHAWHEDNQAEAVRAIIANYPEAEGGTYRGGRIEVTEPGVRHGHDNNVSEARQGGNVVTW